MEYSREEFYDKYYYTINVATVCNKLSIITRSNNNEMQIWDF